MAKLAACDAGRKTEVADRDLLIDKFVGKGVLAFGHGSDENANALLRTYVRYPVTNSHQRSVKTQRDLSAVRRQMVSDGILDNSQKLLLGSRRTNG